MVEKDGKNLRKYINLFIWGSIGLAVLILLFGALISINKALISINNIQNSQEFSKVNFTCVRHYNSYRNLSNIEIYRLYQNSSVFAEIHAIIITCEKG